MPLPMYSGAPKGLVFGLKAIRQAVIEIFTSESWKKKEIQKEEKKKKENPYKINMFAYMQT